MTSDTFRPPFRALPTPSNTLFRHPSDAFRHPSDHPALCRAASGAANAGIAGSGYRPGDWRHE